MPEGRSPSPALPDRKYRAEFNGRCRECEQPYAHGTWIVRLGMGRFAHLVCPPPAEVPAP